MNNNYTLTITKSEAESMVDFIENAFFLYIREDSDVDNMTWVMEMCNIYKRTKEIVDGVKEEEPKKEVEKENLPGYGRCDYCGYHELDEGDYPCRVCRHIFNGVHDKWEAIKTEDEENGDNIRNNHRTCDCGCGGSNSECVHALFD